MYEFSNESIVQPQSLKDSNRVTRCAVNGSCKILHCRSKFVKSAFSIKGWNTLPTKIQHRGTRNSSLSLYAATALLSLISWWLCVRPGVSGSPVWPLMSNCSLLWNNFSWTTKTPDYQLHWTLVSVCWTVPDVSWPEGGETNANSYIYLCCFLIRECFLEMPHLTF